MSAFAGAVEASSGDEIMLTAFAADRTSSSDTADLTLEAPMRAPQSALRKQHQRRRRGRVGAGEYKPHAHGRACHRKLTLATSNVSGGSQASIAFDAVELRVPHKLERPLAVRVHQVSAAVGHGHPGRATA